MHNYTVTVTYVVGRAREQARYDVFRAGSEAEAKRRGRAAHEQRQEPTTYVVDVQAEKWPS